MQSIPSIDELEKQACKIWAKYDFMPLDEVRADFHRCCSKNPKVKRFKKLLDEYRSKQKDFEKTNELFSPYCIGYGNITSPIWFLGDSEGGFDPQTSVDETQIDEKYHLEAKKSDILTKRKVLENVLVSAHELIVLKHKLCNDSKYKMYLNFPFATTIVIHSLGINLPTVQPFPQMWVDTYAGKVQFFIEYWRYRQKTLKIEHISEWDRMREKFLDALDSGLKPEVTIAYPKKNSGGISTRNQVNRLYGKRVIPLLDDNIQCIEDLAAQIPTNLIDYKIKRPVLLTHFMGQGRFSYQNAADIGQALQKYW